jgi:hypothetical protein
MNANRQQIKSDLHDQGLKQIGILVDTSIQDGQNKVKLTAGNMYHIRMGLLNSLPKYTNPFQVPLNSSLPMDKQKCFVMKPDMSKEFGGKPQEPDLIWVDLTPKKISVLSTLAIRSMGGP